LSALKLKEFIILALIVTLTLGAILIGPIAMVVITSFYDGAITIDFKGKPSIALRPYRGKVKSLRALKTWLALYIRNR
jgi:ABC-type spermidine/putrescine transport system permease subunit II